MDTRKSHGDIYMNTLDTIGKILDFLVGYYFSKKNTRKYFYFLKLRTNYLMLSVERTQKLINELDVEVSEILRNELRNEPETVVFS